jgi:hypothetical protein
MKYTPTIYEIPLDISSNRYAQCVDFIEANKSKNVVYRHVKPRQLYFVRVFEEISDKIQNFPNCVGTLVGSAEDLVAQHTYLLRDDAYAVQIFKEFDNHSKESSLILSYIPLSRKRFVIKPHDFKKILKEFRAKKVRHYGNTIDRSQTLYELLTRDVSNPSDRMWNAESHRN